MDLVDLIAEKRFLGQEFLTWLWFKSDERGGTIFLPETGDITLVFEKHMLLEFGEGESHEKIVCQGLQTRLQEARTGLLMGKKLEQARIHLIQGNYEFYLTLTGSLFEFRSVKLPKTMEGSDESDDPMAVEGRILDRIGLLETLTRTIDGLFRLFLQIRISPEWRTEIGHINNWISKAGASQAS